MSKNYKRKLNNIVNKSIRKELIINRDFVKNVDNEYKTIKIDDILDLHGYRTIEAHSLVLDFINNAKENNLRTIRIITGKGVDGYSPLKSYVINILSEQELKYSFAHNNDGGEGAIDIYIK